MQAQEESVQSVACPRRACERGAGMFLLASVEEKNLPNRPSLEELDSASRFARRYF